MTAMPPPAEPSSEALMARAAAGERGAFDLLARRHLPALRAAALRLLDDAAEAEDVAQEAMLRAWRAAGRYDPTRAPAGAWLHRIAVNLAVDRLRRARRVAGPVADSLADPAPGPLAAAERRSGARALAAALAALPARQRRAVGLVYGEDCSGAEAAGRLGISVRALEGLLRRARLLLRAHLSREA